MTEEQPAKTPETKPIAKSPAPAKPRTLKSVTTLAVDVGGTGIKAAALDDKGKMITERQ